MYRNYFRKKSRFLKHVNAINTIVIIIIFNQEAPLTNGGFQGGPENQDI